MTENITPDDTLDCSGLSCPMPLLKTKETPEKYAVRTGSGDHQHGSGYQKRSSIICQKIGS